MPELTPIYSIRIPADPANQPEERRAFLDVDAMLVIASGGLYNVMDPLYGAVGDGVADDTLAIQAAVNAAIAAEGGTVYCPPPSVAYLLGGSITTAAGVNILGAGVDATTFLRKPTFTSYLFGIFGGTFEHFTIDGNYQGKLFTAVAATDVITTDLNLANGAEVTVANASAAGALPAPLLINTSYFLRDKTGSGPFTYKFAATAGGAAINLTTDGTGHNLISSIAGRLGGATGIEIALRGTKPVAKHFKVIRPAYQPCDCVDSSYALFEDFEIQGSGITTEQAYGVFAAQETIINPTVRRGVITDMSVSAIYGGATEMLIEDCDVEGNHVLSFGTGGGQIANGDLGHLTVRDTTVGAGGGPVTSGLEIDNGRWTVENVTITGNDFFGLRLQGGTGHILKNVVATGNGTDFSSGIALTDWEGLNNTPSEMNTIRLLGGMVGIGKDPVNVLDILLTQNASTTLLLTNSDTGVSAQAIVGTKADVASCSIRSHATGANATRYGVVTGGYAELLTTAGNGLLIGTFTNATPIIFGTNSAERMRIDSAGLVSVTGTLSASVGVTTPLITSAADLTIAPTGDLIINATGKDVLPLTTYDQNLGSQPKKFLTLHAAELHVETLVAAETITMINGRAVIGTNATVLIADLAAVATTIDVKHNGLSSGDTVFMEDIGQVEFMAIASGATVITGGFRYTVTRNLDGTGANQWYAGDTICNLGTTGNGWIDIYSIRGIKSALQVGPTIVGNIRNSTVFNDWSEHWAIGNLDGLYGYSGTTFGAAFGKYIAGTPHITIDATNGYRTFAGLSTVVFQIDNTPSIRIGQEAASQDNIFISAGAISIRNNTTARIHMTAAGVMTINDSSGVAKITLDASAGMTLDGKLQMLGASSAIAIGTTPPTSASAGTGIWQDRTGIYGLLSNVVQAKFDAANGRLTGGAGNVCIDAVGLQVVGAVEASFSSAHAVNNVASIDGAVWSAFYDFNDPVESGHQTILRSNAIASRDTVFAISSDAPTGKSSTIDLAALVNAVGVSGINISDTGIAFFAGGLLTEKMQIDTLGRVGIGTVSPTSALDVIALAVASTREKLFRMSVSDASRDFIALSNATTTNSQFLPALFGAKESDNRAGIEIRGATNASNDTSTTALVNIIGLLYPDSDADPVNATYSESVTRPVLNVINRSTVLLSVQSNANVGIGTVTFGTSAAKVLSIATGTAPSTGPADTVQFYSSDDAAGHTIPSFFTEGTNVVATGQADSVSSVRVKFRINGTVRTFLCI